LKFISELNYQTQIVRHYTSATKVNCLVHKLLGWWLESSRTLILRL